MKHIFNCILLSFLFSGCTSLFYQPSRYLYANPNDQKIKFENIYFYSKDKNKLHGWYLHNSKNLKNPKGLIIQFHGNAENMSSHFLSLSWITKYGYDLFVFDYRGYGTSLGTPEKDGVYNDSRAALKKGFQLYKDCKCNQFIIYGQSLGGALAVSAINKFQYKNHISLLVLDSTFMNYKKVAFELMQKSWITWIFSPLAYALISNKYQTELIIKTLTIPTLVIHGKQDNVIQFSNGEDIYKFLNSKQKYFWPIKEGRHISTFSKRNDPYKVKFLDLLKKLVSN